VDQEESNRKDERGSRERTTLATGWGSEWGWLCQDLATATGHFISHTDLSAFAVSKLLILLILLLPCSSSIFLRLSRFYGDHCGTFFLYPLCFLPNQEGGGGREHLGLDQTGPDEPGSISGSPRESNTSSAL